MRISQQQRFESKYVVDEATGCWLWTAGLSVDGYALFRLPKSTTRGHVFAYRTFVGPIPARHQIDHVCHSTDPDCLGGKDCVHRRCVNPSHLEAVTAAENLRRSKNSPATLNSLKTHCPRNHPYAGDNLYISRTGRRVCRACMYEHGRRWRENNREKMLASSQKWISEHLEQRRAYAREYQRQKRARLKAESVASGGNV